MDRRILNLQIYLVLVCLLRQVRIEAGTMVMSEVEQTDLGLRILQGDQRIGESRLELHRKSSLQTLELI